jgi:hypothetical protein
MLTTVNDHQNLVTGRSDIKPIFLVAALRLGCPAAAYDSRFYELHVQRVPGELLFRATTGHVTLLRPKRPADAPLYSSSQCR